MNVVVKHPGEKASVVEVDGRKLHAEVERIIGGYAGRAFKYRLPDLSVMAWCDDDGHPKCLSHNFARPTDGAELVGTIVVTGWVGDGPDVDMAGLDDAQCAEVLALLAAIGVEQ